MDIDTHMYSMTASLRISHLCDWQSGLRPQALVSIHKYILDSKYIMDWDKSLWLRRLPQARAATTDVRIIKIPAANICVDKYT